jgi:hypothetical protein
MFCSECGKLVHGKYCSHCGTQLAVDNREADVVPVEVVPELDHEVQY